jgi:hypothetical protein
LYVQSSPVRVSRRTVPNPAGGASVPVELDLVQPFRPFRRGVDELGKLWRDPVRQGGRG